MPSPLVIDMATLLDKSKVGAAAAKTLEKAWAEAKSQPEDKRRELLAQLERRRTALRAQLLERARPLIAQVAKQKGAEVVLEKGAVLWTAGEDVTQAVMAKVDAAGPLKA